MRTLVALAFAAVVVGLVAYDAWATPPLAVLEAAPADTLGGSRSFPMVCTPSAARIIPDGGTPFPFTSVFVDNPSAIPVYLGGSDVDGNNGTAICTSSASCGQRALPGNFAFGSVFCTTARTPVDGGFVDAGFADGGPLDGGSLDAGSADGGSRDSGTPGSDAGFNDGGFPDGGFADGGFADGGPLDGGSLDAGCAEGVCNVAVKAFAGKP